MENGEALAGRNSDRSLRTRLALMAAGLVCTAACSPAESRVDERPTIEPTSAPTPDKVGPSESAQPTQTPTTPERIPSTPETETMTERMNAIVIVVDDMSDFTCQSTDQYLPKSSKWLKDQGICFENATTPTPVCCPARSEIWTGQYSHNNRVERQIDAHKLRAKNTIQADLGKQGVKTYIIGKGLNGAYAGDVQSGKFDLGFDKTDVWQDYLYWDYPLFDAQGRSYYPDERVHTTTRTGKYMRDFISERAERDEQFYVYAGFFAVHKEQGPGATLELPKPTKAHAYDTVKPLKYRAEQERRDKLPLFRNNNYTQGSINKLHRAQIRSLYDVDDEVAKSFELLEQEGELDNTAFIFVSDNGFLKSNWWKGKGIPHPEAWDVPMLAFIPGSDQAGTIDNRNRSLVDVAPTLYDWFTVRPVHQLDGTSLLDVNQGWQQQEEYHEFAAERSELSLNESGSQSAKVPTWRALKDQRGTYIEYYRNDGVTIFRREFYSPDDVRQSENLLWGGSDLQRPSKRLIAVMAERLHELRECKGSTTSDSPNPCP